MLSAIEQNFRAPGLHVDFSKYGDSTQLNGLFTKDGLRGMLEGKDYRSVDMVFPFVAAFIYRCTGLEEDAPLTRINTTYSEIFNKLLNDGPEEGWSEQDIISLGDDITSCKTSVIKTFDDHCESCLHTLTVHLLDHLVEDVRRFRMLSFIDGSAYENFNVIVKQSYRSTSKLQVTRMEETLSRMAPTLNRVREDTHNGTELKRSTVMANRLTRLDRNGCILVRDGTTITLSALLGSSAQTCSNRHAHMERVEAIRGRYKKNTFDTLGNLVREFIYHQSVPVLDTDIQLIFVKSGFLRGGFLPTLKNYDKEPNVVRYTKA